MRSMQPLDNVSIKENTNAFELLLECHMNMALCQIRQNLFLRAILTLSTVLQYSRKNAQAYYLRGKCHFCLFDYKSAYIDISECLELHKAQMRLKTDSA